MDRYGQILHNFVQWGNQDGRLYAAVVIGSQARSDHPADEFSDLDLMMVVEEPDVFLKSRDWLDKIGELHISFIEETAGGDKELRALLDDALDVDFLILSQGDMEKAIQSGDTAILERGYRILIDKVGLAKALPTFCSGATHYTFLSAQEFTGLVNNFWYHAVWAAKKLIRGEIWIAKSCVDSYMKSMLLTLIECHAHAVNGPDYNTWHDGRFIDEWAEEWIAARFAGCFARYDRSDIEKALLSTMELFRLAAVELAGRLHYEYPEQADQFASRWVMDRFQG